MEQPSPTQRYLQLTDRNFEIASIIQKLQRESKSNDTELLKIKDAMVKEYLEDGVLPDDGLTIRRVPEKVMITDEALLPEHFFKTRREVDKTKINDFVKQNGLIDGLTKTNGGYTVAICRK